VLTQTGYPSDAKENRSDASANWNHIPLEQPGSHFRSAVGLCNSAAGGSDYDRTATFRDYHTFTVMRREHSGLENPLNPLVVTRVEDAIRADLNEKGYVESGDPQAADLLSPS